MGLDIKTLAAAKSYVKATAQGMGAVQGQPGKDGKNGRSAYEIAKDNGFTGTEQDWLNSLSGTDGVDGTDGTSPTIVENTGNTNTIYKLDITDANGTFTTPNLKGADGSGSGGSGEENVQADWNETDTTSDAFIQNKPSEESVDIDFSNYFN